MISYRTSLDMRLFNRFELSYFISKIFVLTHRNTITAMVTTVNNNAIQIQDSSYILNS